MSRMSDKQPTVNPFDPSAWRDARDTYMDAWSKAMVATVNSDQYAKAAGTILDSYLTASGPFREVLEKSMLKVLEQLSMPSRQDFMALAERFTHIEMRLDDMDAKLDRLIKQTAAEPPRQDRTTPTPMKKKRTSAKT
jgi:hypothetical protein